jgi:hypothetical protein
MSIVKISQLPATTTIKANTSNTLFVAVDLLTGGTYKMTAHTLAQGLYSNENLNVGNNPLTLPNTVAQFAQSGASYIQTNLVNTDDGGSADIVVTANAGSGGTDSAYFIDMGFANKSYQPGFEFNNIGNAIYPLDGYLYVQGSTTSSNGGNLIIGSTTTTGQVKVIVGGGSASNIVAKFTNTGLTLNTQSYLTFADGTKQTTNAATYEFSQSLSSNITTLIAVNTSQNTLISAANTLAQNAFDKANSANTLAQSAYNQANTDATSISTTAGVYGNAAYIPVTTIAANGRVSTIVNTAISIPISQVIGLQGVEDSQNASITTLQGGLNTANANIASLIAVSLTQNTKIQSAFDKANNAIANTSDVITAGNFNISGNLTVLGIKSTGLISVNAIPQVANAPAFVISGANNYYSQSPLNSGYMLQITGFPNTTTRIVSDAYGANAYSAYIGRTARGTASAPTSTQNNDILLRVSGNGWGATGFSQFGVGRIDVVATENYTDIAKGSRIEFWNTRMGSNTLVKIASFNADSVEFSGVVTPQKGFIWTPRTTTLNPSTITIDFANDSVIRVNTNSTLTASFTNYTPGKVVDVWITNSAGTNQTFTHGCSALNSTTNSLTWTINGTSTIYAKYISFDSDLANTFVAIAHP